MFFGLENPHTLLIYAGIVLGFLIVLVVARYRFRE